MLTLNELCAVRAMRKLLLERVAAGSVGVRDGGLIDFGLFDRGVGVLVGHVVVVCQVAVDVFQQRCCRAARRGSKRQDGEEQRQRAAGRLVL